MKFPLFSSLLALLLAAGSVPPASGQSSAQRPRIALPKPPPPAKPPPLPAPIAVAPVKDPVVWKSTTSYLTSDTTIEVRFPRPMVDSWGDSLAVDVEGGQSPLTITPTLPGTWVWRSAESGVFVPRSEPARGQEYTFGLRPGLNDAAGRALSQPQPPLTLKAPGLTLVGRHPTWFPSDNASRTPSVLLQFNDKVAVPGAAKVLHFVDSDNHRADVSVRMATYGDLPRGYALRPGFRERALTVAGVARSGAEPSPTLPLPGTLIVTPSEPLPVGKEWKLVVAAVPSADGKHQQEESSAISVGTIDPLMIGYCAAVNEVGAPKRIALRFNKDLAPGVGAEEVVRHVSLIPEPPGYAVAYDKEGVRISGDFKHETPYVVTVTPGLQAEDGLTMINPFRETMIFKVLDPSIALPAFSANQLSKGRGVFDVHSVNLRGARVRVKVADKESLIYALRAYRQYVNPDRGESEEDAGQERIPFDAMPGQKIFEQEFIASAPLDSQDSFVVDWRRALNGRQAGALFITVEGEARPECTGANHRLGAQAFVQLTDIGLAWKLTADEAFVCVFSHSTGQPMPGVTLTAYDSEKNQLAQAATGEDGTVRLARARATWLLAEAGGDLHAVEIDGPGAEGLGMWRFGVPYEWDPPKPITRRVSIFTERPVYLPGHLVYFKALSRLVEADGIKPPSGAEKAVLRAFDAKSRLFHTRDVQFSASGSLDGTLELPLGDLGYYRLEIELPPLAEGAPPVPDEQTDTESDEEDEAGQRRNVFSASFLVEEYKPNTFQTVFDDASFKLDGEKASLSLQSAYLLGKPLAKARLAWSANVSGGRFSPEAYPDFEFLDSRQTYYWDSDGYHDVPGQDSETDMVTGQARAELSDDGRARLDFTVPEAPFASRPRVISLTAEVTDLNQQTIAEHWHKTLHPSAYYLGIRRLSNLSGTGQSVDVALAAARSGDGEPWPEPVEARVTIEKVSFVTVRVQTVGGGSNVKTDAQRGVVAEGTVTVQPRGQETQPFSWSPREPGFYYVTARATDPQGHAVESVTSVQVSGEGWATWEERDGVRIDLSPDKTAYREGETARILVKSPVPGRALITVERRSVMRHFFADIKSNAQVIEVPVDAAMAPNAFVSVFIVRGAEASLRQHKAPDYKVGFVELNVMDARSRLAVTVVPGQPSYRPGDQGTATATVADGTGAPVAGAEVTFWAVDDGVLTLQPYTSPDLWAYFHSRQPLGVVTGTSLMSLLPENPEELAFTNKGYMIGGGGDDSGAGSDRLRRNFQPVAFFQGSLVTDAAGRVSAPFTVPDNLTRFRMVAVAASGADSFGTAEGAFEVNKPLMLEPALPRFANVGDEITVKGIVLNNTDTAFEAQVSLTLDSLASSSKPLVQNVALAARGTQAVAFPLAFNEPGTATWQWKVTSASPGVSLADSVQSTLQIGYAQPALREVHFATLEGGATPVNLLADASPEMLQGSGQVTVTVSNSTLVEMSSALSHLLHYPYGCVEQTTSSTLPWIAASSLGEALPMVKKSAEDVRRAIQTGVNRLLTMQTAGGGLGYWPGAPQPELWASSYGGMGLALARDAGALVPVERMNQLAAYLSGALRQSAAAEAGDDLYTRALACYTLALLGKAEPAYHEVLARKASVLPHPARALLALAILHSGGDRAEAVKVLDAPMAPALESWDTNLFNSRLTAINLLAWIRLDPAHQVTTALTERLLKERTVDGHWGSTYTNAWALLALAEDARTRVGERQEARLTVSFADQTAEITLPGRPATRQVTLPFKGQPSARTLTINGLAAGRARVAVTVEARPQLVPLLPRTEGFSISRTYAKVAADGTTGPVETLEVGDLVAVTLNLQVPKASRYVAVDDPLPAILEAINPKFTSQTPAAEPGAPQDREMLQHWWSSHQELRHDRALFFADSLWSAGKYRLTYLARVVAEGLVTAPPAKIEAMYEPERYGLSGTQRLSARAAAGKVAGTH